MNLQLSGRRAIVAGGAGAVGSVIARTLAEAGAEVTVLDVSIKTVASDPNLKAQQLDLTDVDALRRTAAK